MLMHLVGRKLVLPMILIFLLIDVLYIKIKVIKKAWFKWEFDNLKSASNLYFPPLASYKKIVELTYFNCENLTSANSQLIYYGYDDNGQAFNKSLNSVDIKRLKFTDDPPDSVSKSKVQYICKR